MTKGLGARITEEHIAQYQRDGAVLLKSIFDPEDVRLLEAGVEEIFHEPDGRHARVRSPDGTGETMVQNYITNRSPSLLALVDRGKIPEIAARLMKCRSAQLILDQIFYKTPGRIVPTPWHQDTPFLRVRGMDMIRVWMTCDFSPRDLTVQVVRGSHRWNVVYSTHSEAKAPVVKSEEGPDFSYDGMDDPGLPLSPDIARYRDSFDILSWDVEPGDALIFQGGMLHGAEGRNHYDTPRRAYATMWGGPDLRYHVPNGKAFPPPGGMVDKAVPSGTPISRLEAAFPFGWRDPSA